MEGKNWMIGLLTAIFCFSVFGLFMGGIHKQATITGYDDDNFSKFDRLDEINNITVDMSRNLNQTIDSDSLLDKLGGYFGLGWNTIKLSSESVGTMNSLTSDGVDSANLGVVGPLLKWFLLAVCAILFLFMLIAMLLRRGG